MNSQPQQRRSLLNVLRPTDWSLATKVTALCVGIAAALAVGLTAMGYFQAEDGLRRQAEGALRSDALLVATSMDQWNQQRLQDLSALAAVPTVRRVVATWPNANAEDVRIVQELLDTQDGGRKDVNSFALIDAKGTYFLSSTADVLGTQVPQRDYFQAAMRGQPFVSGMTVSLSTGATVLFYAAPVKDDSGKIVGVIRSRATLEGVQQVVADAENRLNAGISGVMFDQNGLVITSTQDRGWVLRPVVPLAADVEKALVAGSQWGKDKPAPASLGEMDLRPAVGASAPTIIDWHTGDTEYRAAGMPLLKTRWTYVAALPKATFQTAARDFLRNAGVGAGFGLVIAALLASLLARRLAKATNRVARSVAIVVEQDLPAFVRVAQGLAEGDLTQSTTVSAQLVDVSGNDEIGLLAASFNRMIRGLQDTGRAFASMSDNLRGLVTQVQASAKSVSTAANDLTANAEETGAATQQVSMALQHVAFGAADTGRHAQNTSSAVERLMQVIEELDHGASQQAHHVQAANERVAAMTAGVEQVAAHAESVSASSRVTRAAADHGVLAVRDTIAGMGEIQEVVMLATASVQELGRLGERIGAVVETIDGIAEQTNLLALNAAIEAARAGEHGRGFAIVADEVRKLAERSQTETKGIAELIGSVQASTKRAVEAMETGAHKVGQGSNRAGQAGRALQEILQAVDATVTQVAEIASSAKDIAADAQLVNESIGTIHSVVEGNTAACAEMTVRAHDVTEAILSITAVAEEQRAASEELSNGADTMTAQVEEMSRQAASLAMTAERLTSLVSRFSVEEHEEPLRLAA